MKKEIKEHYAYSELKDFLNNQFKKDYVRKVNKDHFDSCKKCWKTWNQVRWDCAKKTQGLLELKEYLGNDFKEYYDSSWALAEEWNEKDPHTNDEISSFYKNTKNYLFNLVIWHESGDRRHFHNDLEKLIEEFSIKSVIDYGCGVGSDSLFLMKNNIKTFMVDFNCPSTDFLKWRIEKQGLKGGSFLNVENLMSLPDGDLFWAIDVLEHVPNPVEIVNKLSDKTKVFVHHSQFNNKAGGRHPCHLYFEEQNLNNALIERGFVNIPWNNMSVWIKKDMILS